MKTKRNEAKLYERQLLTPGLKDFCKNKNSTDNQYCMQHILENQPNFFAQKCMIQEIIKSRDHKVIFYPKFYCELNYIEMYWVLQNVIQEIIVTIHGTDCSKLFLLH